jgi:hypothetical protein
MDDNNTKPELPISMILGARDYSRITHNPAHNPSSDSPENLLENSRHSVGLLWQLVKKQISAVCTSPNFRQQITNSYTAWMYLSSNICQPNESQQSVHQDFKQQLRRSEEGWYETELLWKSRHDEPLPTNESNSLGRLNNLLKKLQRDPEMLDQYHKIIQDQLKEMIVEKVTNDPVKNAYYIPHKPVIRKAAESTKIRIVYDASAKASERSPS